MSIWEYGTHRDHIVTSEVANGEFCIYCGTKLERDVEDESDATLYEQLNYGWSDNFTTRAWAVFGVCPCCGWWKYCMGSRIGLSQKTTYEVRLGILKRLDIANSEIPVEEARQYLLAKFEARHEVHPRLFEEVVASVFRDHGYTAHVTAYSGDGGIDVILDRGDGKTIGVQVKRYKGRISVSLIRELTGALVLAGHLKGIFVTTSEFQSGANEVATLSALRGYPIELVDASGLLKALKIAQLGSARQIIARKPWGQILKWGE